MDIPPKRKPCASISVSLDEYEAERRDFQRVLDSISAFQRAGLAQLQDLEWVTAVVRSTGLAILIPPEELYADEAANVNASHQGITQYPREFARWLILLGRASVRTYLEIGCYNGATACLAAAYLHRLDPAARAITVDLTPWFIFHPLVRDIIPLDYHVGKTSYDYTTQAFDAVFIDGDHSFPWAMADFLNVGEKARVCGIHDVKSGYYLVNEPMSGVTGAWEIIKRDHAAPNIDFIEIFEHPEEHFGIGVRIRRDETSA